MPAPAADFIERLKGGHEYRNLGQWVSWTQTLALLEIVHAGLGWVRSSPVVTGSQVASRLWTVWGCTRSQARGERLSRLGYHSRI